MRKPEPQPDHAALPTQGYSPKNAAKKLGISERKLWQLIMAGKIHAPKISERRRTISNVEIGARPAARHRRAMNGLSRRAGPTL